MDNKQLLSQLSQFGLNPQHWNLIPQLQISNKLLLEHKTTKGILLQGLCHKTNGEYNLQFLELKIH